MNRRGWAVIALVAGLAGAILTAVAWRVAVLLGLVALAVAGLARTERARLERGFAIGGAVLGTLAIVLGGIVGVARRGGEDTSPSALDYLEGVATGTPDVAHPPQADVQKVLDCRAEIGGVIAGGTVKNNTDAPASYSIIVVWEEDGLRIARNTVFLSNVVPGLSTAFRVSAPGDGSQRTTCRTERVDRLPASGTTQTSR